MRNVHRGRLFVLCGVVSVLLAAVPAMAEIDAYMTVEGDKQGHIKGEVCRKKSSSSASSATPQWRPEWPPADGCTPPSPSPKR